MIISQPRSVIDINNFELDVLDETTTSDYSESQRCWIKDLADNDDDDNIDSLDLVDAKEVVCLLNALISGIKKNVFVCVRLLFLCIENI